MSETAQQRALKTYRKRLDDRGLARFEVLGRDSDRILIRTLARRLTDDSPGASRARELVQQVIAEEPVRKGGILARSDGHDHRLDCRSQPVHHRHEQPA